VALAASVVCTVQGAALRRAQYPLISREVAQQGTTGDSCVRFRLPGFVRFDVQRAGQDWEKSIIVAVSQKGLLLDSSTNRRLIIFRSK
jgi:hypothetical protein